MKQVGESYFSNKDKSIKVKPCGCNVKYNFVYEPYLGRLYLTIVGSHEHPLDMSKTTTSIKSSIVAAY